MKNIPILCLALALATNSPGLTINVVKADNADTANPSFDPTLSKLEDIMIAAADYWTDVIKDEHTMTIIYGYQNLDSAILGISEVQTIAANGHANVGAVAFDTQNANGILRPWFFDPTPKQDEEFAMKQVLVADLTPQAVALYYGGTPPGQLEVGFWGDFHTDTDEHDLYTIALHEIGHILGMSSNLPSFISEIAGDNTLDFSPTRLGGNFVEAHIFGPGGEDRLHLRASDALMSPGSGNGDRNLPSATDIFAIASGGNWTDFRLKRVNYLAGNSWGFPLNWAAGQVPSKPQRVYISHGETVEPPASDTLEAGTLTILDDSVLNIGIKTLDVKSNIDLGLQADNSGTLTMLSGGEIEADILSIRDGSRLLTSGNIFGTAVDVDQLRIARGAQLIGTGHILADYLEISGSVIALAPGGSAESTLLLNSQSSASFPGLVQPVYRAEFGNLAFATAPDFSFYGTLHIGAERKVTFLETVTHHHDTNSILVGANEDRAIKLDGGTDPATAATLEVPKGYIGESGLIEVEGFSQILGDATFLDDATVDLDAGSTLYLNGETIFRGGTYQGEGSLLFHEVVTVEKDTTIACGNTDLDGTPDQRTGITIEDSQLTLNTDYREGIGYYYGDMTLNGDGARLNLNHPAGGVMIMFGSLVLNRSRTTGTMLTGDPMYMWGDLRVNGSAQSTTRMVLTGHLNIPGISSSLVLSSQDCVHRKTLTTAGSGSLSISQKGGLEFEVGSDCQLRVSNAGVMELGLKPPFGPEIGTVQISNRFTQEASGILEVDLAGESSSQLLVVTGSASLDGTLRLRYHDGFRAEVGDSFDVLTAENLIGTFNKIEGPDGQRWEANYNELTNTVSVTVTATAYEVWVDENGLTENINDGFYDDPDGDGDPNIKEFAFNGNPLGSIESCRFYPAIDETPAGQIFTVTFPARKGVEFSSGPTPEATIDAIQYRVEGSDDLESFELAVEPYSTVMNSDLPALPTHYEYRTFRIDDFVTDHERGFLRVIIQPAPQ